MKSREKAGHVWQTWWSIAGPKLPDRETRLRPNIILAPLTELDFQRSKTDRVPDLRLAPGGDMFALHYPPRDEVQSRHRMQIDIEACDEGEAIHAAKQAADRLVVSLSLSIPGERYTAEFRKFRQADSPGREISNWSEAICGRNYDPATSLGDEEAGQALALYDTLEGDRTADDAYIHLLSAWKLQEVIGSSKPLERSILQHYFLSIESIVNGVLTKFRRQNADKIRLEERAFANEFASDFAGRADKPRAIREASTRLREISLSNMKPGIVRTAEILSISEQMKDQAIELYELRSQTLSHPGKRATELMHKWLRTDPAQPIALADNVARDFLTMYSEHVRKT